VKLISNMVICIHYIEIVQLALTILEQELVW